MEFDPEAKESIKEALDYQKDEVVDYLNEWIDIPFLNEDQEEVIIEYIYEGIMKIIDKFL